MAARHFVLILGITFLALGVLGFVPGLVIQPLGTSLHPLAIHANDGYLLGLIPVNSTHNLIHTVSGLAAFACFRSFHSARAYSRAISAIYGVLAVIGLMPPPLSPFPLIPVHGLDIWLHAVIALAAAYHGFAPACEAVTEVNCVEVPRLG